MKFFLFLLSPFVPIFKSVNCTEKYIVFNYTFALGREMRTKEVNKIRHKFQIIHGSTRIFMSEGG
jgi:hypothetical protein